MQHAPISEDQGTNETGPWIAGTPSTEGQSPDPATSNWQATTRVANSWWTHTAFWFGLFVLAVVIAVVLSNVGVPGQVAGSFLLVGLALLALTSVAALYKALCGVVDLVRTTGRGAGPDTGLAIAAILGNLVVAAFGALVAYLATFGFARGRQLRRWGRVLLPRLQSGSHWTTSPMELSGYEVPPGVADQWRENGKTEHASVAAFARLALDLMALGAPPTLLAAANQDALDEIRHTEICFSIASAIDGKALGPGPFPEAQRVPTLPRSRTLALGKLAVDSLVDGALHEGVSARVIAKLAQRSEVPAIRAALKEIAADEGRHAAHGWAVVSWCLAQEPDPVAAALRAAVHLLPRRLHSQLPEPAAGGGWQAWGIHGSALEAEEYAAALAHVTERVRGMVGARVTKAA
jgi:hypothetical protein